MGTSSPRPHPKLPQGCSRSEPRRSLPRARTWLQRGFQSPATLPTEVKPAGMASRGSRESRLGWENPAPRVRSRGKAPGPWGSGGGDSAPAAPGLAPQPRGFIPGFQRAPVFPPGVLREALTPVFAPPPPPPSEHHAKFWGVLRGCRLDPPTQGGARLPPRPPARPRTAAPGSSPLPPAQIRARAGINGLGHSGAVTTH